MAQAILFLFLFLTHFEKVLPLLAVDAAALSEEEK